jgi:hypothetical protein
VKVLLASPEEIENLLNSQRVNVLDLLRIAAYKIDFDLDEVHLQELAIKQIYRRHFNFYYSVIFGFIATILVEKQQIEIDFDRNLVDEHLSKQPANFSEVIDAIRASIFTKSLMKNFASIESNDFFTKQIDEFTNSVNNYVEKNCVNATSVTVAGLVLEAFTKYINTLIQDNDLEKPITSEDKKQVLGKFNKFSHKNASKRLEVKQGGSRPRKGFVWTDECKIKFYETVENLPKIKNKLMWDYAFEKLNEEDFNYKYIDYLKTETAFKTVPNQLFQTAIITWQKYKDSFIKVKPNEKPLTFALNHALSLLNYPEPKFSTMKRYYGQGKKLFFSNNLKNENSK